MRPLNSDLASIGRRRLLALGGGAITLAAGSRAGAANEGRKPTRPL
jgi:hypothetical protein